MDRAETWQRLIELGAAKGTMPYDPFGPWNLSGVDLTKADLSGADLSNVIFRKAILMRTNLAGADLTGADLGESFPVKANFEQAKLSSADLSRACLAEANLSRANLTRASLAHADLSEANLTGANLAGANLAGALLLRTIFSGATLTGCYVYGVSAWGVILEGVKEQSNLLITPPNEPAITIDNLEVAQFVYLLLHSAKIRSVIDTIGMKGVLILGRFNPPERKAVLDAIRNKLRELGFVPIMFDFEKPVQRDFTETIKILAGMSRFIIADITSPKSCPLELQATVPDYKIPFVPIIQEDEKPFSMFQDLTKYPWMFELLKYDSVEKLVAVFKDAIVNPALERAKEFDIRRNQAISNRHVDDYLKGR
ncbi:MAG: pentapeptide repeat-containing protein [Desulforhopalus sp.]|nr:pentapeptide repeat-containing protein [Desulforhopalus sp.]